MVVVYSKLLIRPPADGAATALFIVKLVEVLEGNAVFEPQLSSTLSGRVILCSSAAETNGSTSNVVDDSLTAASRARVGH